MKSFIKRISVLALILLAISGIKAEAQKPSQAKYVVLITVDGFRPEFYLDSCYGMFTVRELMKKGIAVKGVNPVFPSVTYPDHTTMISGVTPAKHGIFYNTPFEPEGETGKWNWDYNLIKVPTIWTAMHDAGRTTACVSWPVTYNAPIDYRIPECWDYKNPSNTLSLVTASCYPKTLFKEVQDNATGRLSTRDITCGNEELLSDENIARISSYLISRYKPNFIAIHLPCVDHYEHEYGREAYMVHAAVTGADRSIKSILEGIHRANIQDSTLVIVLGDHGFENVYRYFNPNYLLKQNGLITDIKKDEWKAQFHSQGGSTFLQLKNADDKKTVKKVMRILENLPDTVKQYFAIIDKEKLKTVGADPSVDLALTGLKGTEFGTTTKELFTKLDRVRGNHGFYPDHHQIQTGLVACGPGLKSGLIINEMNMTDVAPLIVHLSGITLPNMDGKLHTELLK